MTNGLRNANQWEKVDIIKKITLNEGGGTIDLWYLEWRKQEKHIDLFPIHQ